MSGSAEYASDGALGEACVWYPPGWLLVSETASPRPLEPSVVDAFLLELVAPQPRYPLVSS
jgi:hypothetical protein